MIQSKNVLIELVKKNPDNPRTIRDTKFADLKRSIESFPAMMKIRPIVVDSELMILGGNMRYEACKELGWEEIPIILAGDLTEKQKQEFIIKDNVGYGDWNWSQLANEWEAEDLNEWGLDIPIDIEGEEEEGGAPESTKIVLEFTGNDYTQVMDILDRGVGTKEDIFFRALIKAHSK